GFHVPRIAEIQVVRRDNTLIESRGSRRIQSQGGAAARVHDLGLAYNAERLGIQVIPVGDLRSGQIGRLVAGGKVDTRSVRDLISDRRINTHAIVIALVIVEVALISATELEQVVA